MAEATEGVGGSLEIEGPVPPPPHADLDSASVDSDMYDLPKKEDALLYQSKGKAGVGWALMSLTHASGIWAQGNSRPHPLVPVLSGFREEKLAQHTHTD